MHLLAMAAVLIFPIIFVAVLLAVELYRSQHTLFVQRAQDAARNNATAVEREIAGMTRTLRVLATSEALRAGDFSAFQRQATETARVEDVVIVIRDAQSQQLLNTNVPLGEALQLGSNLQQIDREAESSGAPVVSNYFVAVSDQRQSFGITLRLDDAAGGARYLSVSSSTARLRQLLRDETGAGWNASLMDRNGVVLTRLADPDTPGEQGPASLRSAIASAARGATGAAVVDGTKALSAFERMPFGWSVVVSPPGAVLDTSLKRLLSVLGGGLVALVALAIALAMVMARKISAPVVALENISASLARGEPVVSLPSTNAEANVVGRLLETSSRVLRDSEQALSRSQMRYRTLFETIDEAFCLLRLIRNDAGEVIDFLILETNSAYERHTGILNAAGRTAAELGIASDKYWMERYAHVVQTGESIRFERQSSYDTRWLDVRATCISKADAEVALLIEDVTDQRRERERLRISEARFRAIQETSVDGFMMLESIREDGRIVDFMWLYANDAAANIVGKPKDWFAGRRLLKEMPGNRRDGLFDAYVHVVETGAPWTNEFRYLNEGLDVYIRAVAAKAEDGFAISFADLSVRRRAEEQVRESQARLEAALRAGQLGVHEYLVGPNVIRWDDVVHRLWGVEASETVSYETFEAGVHPDDLPAVRKAVAGALDPASNGRYIAEYRVINRQSGKTRWVVAEGQTTFAHGKPERLLGTVRDVTARRRAEEQRILLINELNHRVKNTLATVQSLAAQSFRQAPTDAEPFLARFNERLFSLARAHGILTEESWSGADLKAIIDAALQPVLSGDGSDRILREGPEIRLNASQSLALAMAMHELATNAMKYGSLSVISGRIEIGWTCEDRIVRLQWRELGGPKVEEPERRGFGMRLLTRALSTDLNGEVTLRFEPEGVICLLQFRLGGDEMVNAGTSIIPPEGETHGQTA
jgi:PAS domain S-box-containing protein